MRQNFNILSTVTLLSIFVLLTGCSGNGSTAQPVTQQLNNLENYISEFNYFPLDASPKGDYQQNTLTLTATATLTHVQVGFYTESECSPDKLQKVLNISSEKGVVLNSGSYVPTDLSNYHLVQYYEGNSGAGSLAELNEVKSLKISYVFLESTKPVNVCLNNPQLGGEKFADYSQVISTKVNYLLDSSNIGPCTPQHCSTSQSYSSYYNASCPVGQIKCANGGCADGLINCPIINPIVSTKEVQCKNGAWALSTTLCNDNTCPDGKLVCPNGACVADIANCAAPASCRSGYVLCPNGRCQANISLCNSSGSGCPSSSPVRCPAGDCAANISLCPEHSTCPTGTEMCNDGSCQQSCSGTVKKSKCSSNQVECPPVNGKVSCAADLAQCPIPAICPSDMPVKCQDNTCAKTVADCPAIPNNWSNSHIMCPSGNWSDNFNNCGSPAACPGDRPYKCWNNTCRASSDECPKAISCPKSTPVLCPEGNCVESATQCKSPVS